MVYPAGVTAKTRLEGECVFAQVMQMPAYSGQRIGTKKSRMFTCYFAYVR